MSHVISWPNRGGHGFCLKTVFLLGRHPFPGVAAEEMYISWFGTYAQNSLFSSRSVIARRKPVRDAIFFPFYLLQKGARGSIHLYLVKEDVPLVCGTWEGWRERKDRALPWPSSQHLPQQCCGLQRKCIAGSLCSLSAPGAHRCKKQPFPHSPRLYFLTFLAIAPQWHP